MISNYPIDIRKVIASKAPKAAAKLPKWLVNLLTKILHINDVNYLLTTYETLQPQDFAKKVIEYTGASYKTTGMENIPEERCIFVSNHPLGGLDGLILICSLFPYCKNGIQLIVNDFLMYLKPLNPLFIPVNKHGRQSEQYSITMEEAFESDRQIVTFPAGLCSRLINGEITDPKWQRSFATKAIATNRTVVPVYFEGRNSWFFYYVAKIRKVLKIKFNIEMMLLPHEMFCPTSKNITIHVGKPFKIDKGISPKEATEIARKKVYEMRFLRKVCD